MDAVTLTPPVVGSSKDTWGDGLNALLDTVEATLNSLIAFVNANGTSGFIFWNGTAWPSDTPMNVPFVFFSAGSTGVPEPTRGANNSIWIY